MDRVETPEGAQHFSRSELELELGKLALTIERLRPRSAQAAARGHTVPQPIVDGFLDAGVRILARTRRTHRGVAIQRLCEIAAVGGLGLIGLEAWLGEQFPAGAVTSDRLRAHPPQGRAAAEASRHA